MGIRANTTKLYSDTHALIDAVIHAIIRLATMSSMRRLMQVPTDAECFRADLDYLKDDEKGLSTGTTGTQALRVRSENDSEGTRTYS